MKILFITADGFEDSELLCPMYRLKEAGFQVDIAAPEWGEVKGKHGYSVTANLTFQEVEPSNYRLLLIPGGKAPEKMRIIPRVRDIVRSFAASSTPIAAICHGPQVLASAGLLEGRHVTCYRKIAREIQVAGAIYEDKEVVIDNGIITSREPGDIPAFMKAIMNALSLKST